MNKDFLIKLRESHEFLEIMAEAAKARPIVPEWRPLAGDEGNRLIEEIKFKQGMRAGFDALFKLLSGKEFQS